MQASAKTPANNWLVKNAEDTNCKIVTNDTFKEWIDKNKG
jgi:hypothetical protein